MKNNFRSVIIFLKNEVFFYLFKATDLLFYSGVLYEHTSALNLLIFSLFLI